MKESRPSTTFRGLPLTPEQDSEIRHYIHTRERSGAPWDTPELAAMLADMLDPPELAVEERKSIDDCTRTEHATALSGADTDAVPSDAGQRGA
ncbi:hypothetical protein NX784_06365 [Massilia pinisoli]|uniref:Uncharacterized protein n=1 Tax=Massilia pinisoli TaxID=1772194 RepID=A0ABT1ZNB8_9BURK|nr:hypothetical protein [Massilia pinisoli]MCS0581209.1 hypothetical protein [Massilia pinisoli]